MSKIITVKNIRGYKIDIFYDKSPYTVQDLINELSKNLGDDVKYTEYKILLNGDVLDDNYDLTSDSTEGIIYLRRAKKDNTENLENVAKQALGLYLGTLLKNPESLKTIMPHLPDEAFTNDLTQLQACESDNINKIHEIIKSYVNNFNLPYNNSGEFPKIVIYDQKDQHNALSESQSFLNKGVPSGINENEDENSEESDNSEDDDGNYNDNHCTCGMCHNYNGNEESEGEEDEEDGEPEVNEEANVNNGGIVVDGWMSEETMRQFTDEERNDIDEIVQRGHSLFEAAQMYVACDKDLGTTLELLETI